jgi:AsmA protein
LLPLETIRGLKLNADLGLDELTTSGLKIEAISLKVRADGGLIEIPEVAGKLYGGAFNNRATIDARRTPVTFKIHKAITAVQLGGMLQDLSDSDLFTGTFDMVGDYRAKGNSIYAIVNSLDGKMTLNVANGRLQGVNLVDKLCRGLSQLRGVQPTESGVADYTEFSNLGGSVVINSGVMDNRDLTAALAGVSLDGAGSVDLPNEALDYGLSLTILQELKGPNCQIEEKLHNLAFPVRCRGGFDDDPKKMCRPDTDKMKQVIAELGTREVKEKVLKRAQEKLEERFKDNDAIKGLLKGLF